MKSREYPLIDCTDRYHSIMQFDKNKNVFVHRWYPFVEGYSKEFIEDILNEIAYIPTCALEPFSGSGTTPVELQNHNIRCWSFEVSPFMHLLARAKLERTYSTEVFNENYRIIEDSLMKVPHNIREVEAIPFGESVVYPGLRGKWNFHDEAIDGIMDIRHVIRSIDDKRYHDLFTIALASIIMYCSNMFRNGKCLSYKKGWQERKISRNQVHDLFLARLKGVFAEDISKISNVDNNVCNANICIHSDVRQGLKHVPDNSVDLVITSPPYLNSRDYTDIYMLELKMLELINDYGSLRDLRGNTLRSHVQVSYEKVTPIDNQRLKRCLAEMNSRQEDLKGWNINILNMICGYFEDLQTLFRLFRQKMKKGGALYFNVANSAYYGVEIPVDHIISDIAEEEGFVVREIRKARDIKASPQQAGKIGKLRESVIVIDS